MDSEYDQWADMYDVVYSYVRSDIPFYVETVKRHGGPVLELGCGTGRVTVPIAEAGVEIVGMDISKSMLDVAKTNLAESSAENGIASLVYGDMSDFSLGQSFSAIIVPFRGFLSLLTTEEQTRSLDCISRHLSPGGHLVFDVFVPDLDMLVQEEDILYHLRDVVDHRTGQRVVLWNRSRYDNHQQIIEVTVIGDVLSGLGDVERRFYRDFRIRYVHRWEMHHLLTTCGFEVLEVFGDFNKDAFDEFSTEMIWVTGVAK
jgi:ubiquinone/menaquinone biosynthesis C-methylase UbiE